ncbi:peptidase U32 family protein [Desulfonatronovibrio magnus]|uniref:peptidase U32 family protein n=1 Tax=Desulfonatronovibrio magnus TaxID=698827 RepID=UPI0005EBE6B0|nr:peptidase U32 family protein [Desulfonatronovibrio magnus]
MERLETALAYGADAVYLGGSELNLRSKAKGFSNEELHLSIEKAHSAGAKAYFCLNALPLQKDIPKVEKLLDYILSMSFDALIVADPGVLNLIRKRNKDIPLHLSTQANTCNLPSISFWQEQGVKRVNLSRELSIKDINAILKNCSQMELEMFVHGAMCMAVSGRCFLSAHLNKRSANQGLCAHPCRYDYRPHPVDLEEKTRPGYPVWTVKQGPGFSKIFSAEDLCLVKFIPWMIRNRLHSLKIEGRTKSVSYIAMVADIYRTAIDDFFKKQFRPALYLSELGYISTRPLGSGFFLYKKKIYTTHQKAAHRSKKILARVIERLGDHKWLLQIKDKWNSTDDIEIILPGLHRPVIRAGQYSLENLNGQKTSQVNSGVNAFLCAQHPDIKKHLFVRTII